MTPDERAKETTEAFADRAAHVVWGCDHIRYKGADEILTGMIAHAIRTAVAAERERCAALCENEGDWLRPWMDDPGEVLTMLRDRIREGSAT